MQSYITNSEAALLDDLDAFIEFLRKDIRQSVRLLYTTDRQTRDGVLKVYLRYRRNIHQAHVTRLIAKYKEESADESTNSCG